MSTTHLLNRISRLRYTRHVKVGLRRLAQQSRKAAEKLVAFLQRNKPFAESLILGLIAALLLSNIPVVGHLLAILAVAASAGVGLLRQLKQAFFADSVVK